MLLAEPAQNKATRGAAKMQKLSEPAFAQQLQEALSRGGRVVIIEPALPLPPPRDRDEAELIVAFCTLFDLQAREARLLAKLLANEYQTLEELRAAVAPKRTPNSMRTFLSLLRKKLATHAIEITHAHGIGYYLGKESRQSLYQQLAQHDANNIPKRQPKAETPNARHAP
jgi:hypothetical protein